MVPGEFLYTILRRPGAVVFGAAQGVLLDEWRGFHPHTTWSTTTLANADRLLGEAGYNVAGRLDTLALTCLDRLEALPEAQICRRYHDGASTVERLMPGRAIARIPGNADAAAVPLPPAA